MIYSIRVAEIKETAMLVIFDTYKTSNGLEIAEKLKNLDPFAYRVAEV